MSTPIAEGRATVSVDEVEIHLDSVDTDLFDSESLEKLLKQAVERAKTIISALAYPGESTTDVDSCIGQLDLDDALDPAIQGEQLAQQIAGAVLEYLAQNAKDLKVREHYAKLLEKAGKAEEEKIPLAKPISFGYVRGEPSLIAKDRKGLKLTIDPASIQRILSSSGEPRPSPDEDIRVTNYKKSVKELIDRWHRETEALCKEIAAINEQLNKADSPAARKSLKEKRSELQKKIDQSNGSLRVSLMLIEPPAEAPKSDLIKLPGWIEKIIAAKGIPVGSGLALRPDVSFDFDKVQFKKLGIILIWTW